MRVDVRLWLALGGLLGAAGCGRPDPAKFEIEMARFLVPVEKAEGRGPYVRGKLLPVGRNEGGHEAPRAFKSEAEERAYHEARQRDRVHPIYFDLPKGLLPKRPGDVQTVLRIHCGAGQVGRYVRAGQATGGAMKWGCRTALIDLVDRVLLEEREFEGGAPSGKSTGYGNQYGEIPYAAVVAYLAGLPRR